jgi:hypothetical protein
VGELMICGNCKEDRICVEARIFKQIEGMVFKSTDTTVNLCEDCNHKIIRVVLGCKCCDELMVIQDGRI